jgi:glycogen synthase
MKILLASQLFSPSIGGVETVVEILAQQFTESGHQVRVVTFTPGQDSNRAFEVYRIRNMLQFVKQLLWCDILVQPNVSLKFLLPSLLFRRPTFVTHQQWYRGPDGKDRLIDKLKRWLCRYTHNISISAAIANHIGHDSTIIPNPYDSKTFYLESEVKREASLVCVARLVSDKGVDTLLDAVAMLGQKSPKCTIIGDGPEKNSLIKKATELHITDKVSFLGFIQGGSLRQELNKHTLMVVPSKNPEPFGIVALEGIACGCVIVGTNQGGLGEAIGSCGVLVPNGDSRKISEAIENIFNDLHVKEIAEKNRGEHLRQHTAEEVAYRYLGFIERRLNGTS